MRVLFICQFFAPDITAAAFRMSDFARLLAEAGDDVRVITSFPHKACVDQVDDSEFAAAGVTVHRCHIPKVEGTGARPYLRHYLSFVRGSLRLGWQIWWAGWKPDVIYASSPPLFVGISARVLSLLFWRPMVFEVRDIWPDAAVSAGQLSAGGTAYRLGRVLERYLYRKANHITCVARPMRDYLQQFARVPITVVYNGISSNQFADPAREKNSSVVRRADPPDHSESGTVAAPAQEKSLAIEEHPEVVGDRSEPRPRTILYAGNLGHVQQLDLLVTAVAQLADVSELDGWRIQLLGAGAQRDNLKQLAQRLQVADRIDFLPAVSQPEAARMMQQADILYLHLMHDSTMERTIPSKLFDYLLAGRPIVGGLAGEGRELLESTGANIVFEPGNRVELQQALVEAVRTWPERCEAVQRNRDLVLNRFTRRASSQVLRKALLSVCGKSA